MYKNKWMDYFLHCRRGMNFNRKKGKEASTDEVELGRSLVAMAVDCTQDPATGRSFLNPCTR
jgi:hypothetical protein